MSPQGFAISTRTHVRMTPHLPGFFPASDVGRRESGSAPGSRLSPQLARDRV
jgi:hypothetical protein